jgi:hypothetical protein
MSQLVELSSLSAVHKHYEYLKIAQQFSLIVPALMPDELLLGYFGRFGFVNGYLDYLTAKKTIKNIFVNHFHKEYQYPLALQLAHILNIEPEKIVANHTLVPIMRRIDHQNIPSHNVGVLKALEYSLAKLNVCFCENCISEDLNFIGYTYWRRSHQIHGIDFCSKHGTPLMMATDENAHYLCPYKISKSRKFLQQNITLSEYGNPVIQKYIELIEGYLEIQSTINFKNLMKMLNHSAQTNNKAKSQATHNYISDYIINNTPNNWLVKHFSFLKNKSLNNPIGCIDSPHRAPSLFNLLLMISNLVPEADSQILRHQSDSVLYTTPRRNIYIRKSKVINLYKKHGGNYSRIHEELAKLKLSGMHLLDQLRLPPLDDLNDATLNAVFDFFKGTSLIKISQRESVDISAFEKIIRTSSQLKILA